MNALHVYRASVGWPGIPALDIPALALLKHLKRQQHGATCFHFIDQEPSGAWLIQVHDGDYIDGPSLGTYRVTPGALLVVAVG